MLHVNLKGRTARGPQAEGLQEDRKAFPSAPSQQTSQVALVPGVGGRGGGRGRGWCLQHSGSQGVPYAQNPVVLVGAASPRGRGSAKGRELEQGKVKVMET